MLKRVVSDIQAGDPEAVVVVAADMNCDKVDIPDGMVDVWEAQHAAELAATGTATSSSADKGALQLAYATQPLLEKRNGHTWPASPAKPPTATLDHVLAPVMGSTPPGGARAQFRKFEAPSTGSSSDSQRPQFRGCWLTTVDTLVSDHYPLVLECTAH